MTVLPFDAIAIFCTAVYVTGLLSTIASYVHTVRKAGKFYFTVKPQEFILLTWKNVLEGNSSSV